MSSETILKFLENNNYEITDKDYIVICSTSPQIRENKYLEKEKMFFLGTDDGYNFKFVIK